MLQYIKGRFHLGGASFAIPEAFFLDPTPPVPFDNSLSLHSPDKKYDITISFDNQAQSTDESLNDLFRKEYGFKLFHPVTSIRINGLSGHYAIYQGTNDQYHEARFQLAENRHLAVLTHTDREVGIRNIVNTRAFHEILKRVRRD